MPQYNTSLFYMYVLNGRQRLVAVVVVSSGVVKIDGADSDTFSANPTELITTLSHCVVYRRRRNWSELN